MTTTQPQQKQTTIPQCIQQPKTIRHMPYEKNQTKTIVARDTLITEPLRNRQTSQNQRKPQNHRRNIYFKKTQFKHTIQSYQARPQCIPAVIPLKRVRRTRSIPY